MSDSAISLDKVFTKRMSDLQAGVNADGGFLETNGFIKWIPLYTDKENSSTDNKDGKDGKTLNGFDSDEFIKAFKREELNKAYVKALQPADKPTAYRDAQVSKVQIDLMAGYERELRMRYRSRVRMLAHGIGRVQSQGLGIGPINKGIVNFVKLLMDRQA